MKQNHLFTNVTAIIMLFVVLLLGGMEKTAVVTPQSIPVSTHIDQNTSARPIEVAASAPVLHHNLASNLKKAYFVGREIGNPETIEAILLQESTGRSTDPIGNKNAPVGKRSYGLMQLQVVAARSILGREPKLVQQYFPGRKYSSIADEEIIALLLTNDEANIRIAAHHFKLYLNLCDGDWNKAVAAYNTGIGGVNNIENPAEYQYVVSIKTKLESEVRSFNRKNNLQLTQQF